MTFQSSNITQTRQGENPLTNQTRSLLLLPNQTHPFSTRQITVCTPENRSTLYTRHGTIVWARFEKLPRS
jgi:hypothetical protein